MTAGVEVNAVDLDSTWSLRGSNDATRDGPRDNQNPAPAAQAWPASAPSRDWTAALALVQEAAEAIRLGEERIEELRREADEQAEQHHADLKALHAQLVGAQREIEAANHRARAAEQKAREAIEWLSKLDDAIRTHFGSIDRSSGS
ncbi:hypothetical protein [Aureimonas sp. Leaf454]|uniref:hypothetical protein n=1 Tax=Aureimonas sp. Leaf454 TaxID=1736381 RepID=UPI0012E34F10|nr:hypothetical protein [Aureimonas sp. Leaf454]